MSAGCSVSEPENIISDADDALRVFFDASPKTHLNASLIFDFPEPFGPTTTIKPSLNSITVGCAKDLNPLIFILLKNII